MKCRITQHFIMVKYQFRGFPIYKVLFKLDLVSCVSHAFASVHCCLVVTCWERTVLLALVGDVYSIFVTFPCGFLGQVWYLIVSFPDLCHLSYYTVLYFSDINKPQSSDSRE